MGTSFSAEFTASKCSELNKHEVRTMMLKYAESNECRPCGWTLHGGFEEISYRPIMLRKDEPFPACDYQWVPMILPDPEHTAAPEGGLPAPKGIPAVWVTAYKERGGEAVRFIVATEAYITNDKGDTLEVLNR